MSKDQVDSKSGKSEVVHAFEFDSVYANNTRFEPSVWDLKILFGELMQHTGKESVNWHTAVTVPWMQIKILDYYLRVNIAFHEIQNGAIRTHPNVTPPKPEPPSAEKISENPLAPKLYEAALKIHLEMFG
jgi:hypothetical protein